MTRTLTILASIALGAPTAMAGEAEQVEDLLTRAWYEIEFFVFERPEVLDLNTDEALTQTRPRRLPATMRSLPDADGYPPWPELDAATRDCLVFPNEYPQAVFEPALDEPPQATPEAGGTEYVEAPFEPALLEPVLDNDPAVAFRRELESFEQALEVRSNRWLEPRTHLLAREASLIERRGVGRVLFHGRWLQALPARDAPEPLLIEAGRMLGLASRVPEEQRVYEASAIQQVRELVGTVAVTLGRYLHFDAKLYLHAPLLGARPISAVLRGDGGHALPELDEPEGGYMVLAQSRRMRSGEVHYLDHPKLGIVIRIDPVEIPAELVETFEALEEPVQ